VAAAFGHALPNLIELLGAGEADDGHHGIARHERDEREREERNEYQDHDELDQTS